MNHSLSRNCRKQLSDVSRTPTADYWFYMAGYSGTPLRKKIGIKEGDRVLVVNPPRRLPEDLRDVAGEQPNKNIDVLVLFVMSQAEFRVEFEKAGKKIHPDGMVWIAWPKKASGIKTDLTEDVIRNFAREGIFVDVKVCAIDETWSGLKLVIRKELRAARAKA